MDLLLVAFFFLGAIFASFAGVLAERLHTGEGWFKSRSRCNSCGRVLSVLDLVPVVSWVLSRGRCRTCGSRVPALYLIAECVLGFLFALSYTTLGLTGELPLFLLALVILLFIVLYDLRHTVVPAFASLLLVIVSLGYAFRAEPVLPVFGQHLLIAGLIGLGFFLLYALSRGRAMGLGDAPVAFGLSLLAAPYALPGLLFSFWAGALIGIAILVMRPGGPKMGIEVPFVPFLAFGFLLAFFIQWNPFVLL